MFLQFAYLSSDHNNSGQFLHHLSLDFHYFIMQLSTKKSQSIMT